MTEKKKENIINISDNLLHIEQPIKYSQAEFTKTDGQEDRKHIFITFALPWGNKLTNISLKGFLG